MCCLRGDCDHTPRECNIGDGRPHRGARHVENRNLIVGQKTMRRSRGHCGYAGGKFVVDDDGVDVGHNAGIGDGVVDGDRKWDSNKDAHRVAIGSHGEAETWIVHDCRSQRAAPGIT